MGTSQMPVEKEQDRIEEAFLFVGKQWDSGEGDGTHSGTLAWKVPWTEEPGGLQSMGSL